MEKRSIKSLGGLRWRGAAERLKSEALRIDGVDSAPRGLRRNCSGGAFLQTAGTQSLDKKFHFKLESQRNASWRGEQCASTGK